MEHVAVLISGAGDLGRGVARKLCERLLKPQNILCETRGPQRHLSLREEDFRVRIATDPPPICDSLLISFPPSEDYEKEVARALACWNKSKPALLVSSIGVFTQDDGSLLDETSAVDESSALFRAETLAREAGAHVLRLAGLYDDTRGPQFYWQEKKKVTGWPGGLVNLIHREDAAEACVRLMRSELPADTWCLSDGNPVLRGDIVQVWSRFKNEEPAVFTETNGVVGKKISSSKLREALEWEPRHASFRDFVAKLSLR
ncbi:MAG: hypothetical protein ABIR96_12035 [Bdellovibrionota bacterium]